MNPLQEEILEDPQQLRLLNIWACLAGAAIGAWVIVSLCIAENLEKGNNPSIFWWIVEAVTLITFVGFIVAISPRIRNRWSYTVSKDNTNIYFLNDADQVELAKPGKYRGPQKSRLFKIELQMDRRAQFIVPGSYLCYVDYQIRFYYQPTPEQIKSFLDWLKELEELWPKGQIAVMNKLKQDEKEGNYSFKVYGKFNELGIVF